MLEGDVVDRAAQAAAEAAATAGCTVRTLSTVGEQRAAADLFDDVWGPVDHPVMPSNLIRAIDHAGGYVAGAFAGDRMVGASVAFLGRGGGATVLHSHITGSVPGRRGRGVGFALKQHQRVWSLERGIDTAVWTFDPLVARNAYFNLRKLGAVVDRYYPSFYGRMDDALNAGDETDRCLATWRLTGARALAAAEGRGPAAHGAPDATAPTTPVQARAATLLDADELGLPAATGAALAGPAVRLRVPPDYHALRVADVATADAWRRSVREVLGGALDDGYVAVDATAGGWWTLVRGDVAAEEDAR